MAFVVTTLFSGEIPRSAIYIFDVASSTPLMLLVRNLPLTRVPRCSFSFLPPTTFPLTLTLSLLLSFLSASLSTWLCHMFQERRMSLDLYNSEPSKYRDIFVVDRDAGARRTLGTLKEVAGWKMCHRVSAFGYKRVKTNFLAWELSSFLIIHYETVKILDSSSTLDL